MIFSFQAGAVLDKSLQPHESHIPFILQFLVCTFIWWFGITETCYSLCAAKHDRKDFLFKSVTVLHMVLSTPWIYSGCIQPQNLFNLTLVFSFSYYFYDWDWLGTIQILLWAWLICYLWIVIHLSCHCLIILCSFYCAPVVNKTFFT